VAAYRSKVHGILSGAASAEALPFLGRVGGAHMHGSHEAAEWA